MLDLIFIVVMFGLFYAASKVVDAETKRIKEEHKDNP